MSSEFDKWLSAQLRAMNTDESVFGAYITGILENNDETTSEKTEALQDLLSEIVDTNTDDIIKTILAKWDETHPKEDVAVKKPVDIDVNKHLAALLAAQTVNSATQKERQYTEEERRIREQILAQYSQTEVEDLDAYDDDEDDGEKPAGGGSSGAAVERNTNVHDVMELQKARREQARLDSAAKKQKDKEDREKQKQLREEKKEKRKTVKGERRR